MGIDLQPHVAVLNPRRKILNTRGTRVFRAGQGFKVEYFDDQNKRQVFESSKIIVTTGSHSLNHLLPDIGPEIMDPLTDLRYARVIEVAIGFKEWNGMQPDGFGGLVPFREKRDLLGILFPSAFLEGRAPASGALFTVFIGGVRRPKLFDLKDQELFELVGREFTQLMGIDRFKPDLFKSFKYPWAIPQYEQSSGARFKAISHVEQQFPGLLLRGNFQGGIGLADRIKQGKQAALQIIDRS